MRYLHAAAMVAVLTLAPRASIGAEPPFQLTSPSVEDGGRLPSRHALNEMGCEGANLSPALRWKGAPKATRSFALSVYDPDAPTGSGWWHWMVIAIPASAQNLNEGSDSLPPTARQTRTDFGAPGYGGPCPPVGDKPHRYIFTLDALDVEHLDLPADSSGAMVGFAVRTHSLGRARLTAFYGR